MVKADLVQRLINEMGLSRKEAESTLDVFLSAMIDSLKDGHGVELRGFGAFRIRERRARVGRNPRTGESVKVPPKKVVYFKVGKELKEAIGKK